MPSWTHLIRFIAVEDNHIHLGQLVDTSRDVGRDTFDGVEVKAYLINGSVFDGQVTDRVYTVKQVNPVGSDPIGEAKSSGMTPSLCSCSPRSRKRNAVIFAVWD